MPGRMRNIFAHDGNRHILFKTLISGTMRNVMRYACILSGYQRDLHKLKSQNGWLQEAERNCDRTYKSSAHFEHIVEDSTSGRRLGCKYSSYSLFSKGKYDERLKLYL